MSTLSGSQYLLAMGGVWLDEIRTRGKPTLENVLGGSVTFATLGARLFAPATTPTRMVFIAGQDFPQAALRMLHSWNLDVTVHWHPEVSSARGIVHYQDSEDGGSKRTYERLTQPLLTSWTDLSLSDITKTSCFHFFDTPQATQTLIDTLTQLRTALHAPAPSLLIWEPQAKSCTPDTFTAHLSAAEHVHVFSPNHIELHCLFSSTPAPTFSRTLIEQQAQHVLTSGIGTAVCNSSAPSYGCIIVRCAQYGALLLQPRQPAKWLPAFHAPASPHVIDPTGAGNAFLGGVAVGWCETGDFVAAAQYGAVAASFVIEQVGAPTVSGHGAEELWNGEPVRRRLDFYQERCNRDWGFK